MGGQVDHVGGAGGFWLLGPGFLVPEVAPARAVATA